MRTVDKSRLKIDPRERRARLSVADDEPERGEAEALLELLSIISPAYEARLVTVQGMEDGVMLDGLEVLSRDLAFALRGVDKAYIIVATLGFEVDRLISRYITDTYRQFLYDALSDCLVESVLDEATEDLGGKELFTNRFSPGYGDLPLSYGRDLVRMSVADKTLGIRFSESGLMSPKKSVNCIIGIRR